MLPERILSQGDCSLVSVQIMSVELQWPASAPPLDIGLLMSESDTATPRPAPPPPTVQTGLIQSHAGLGGGHTAITCSI